MEYRDIQKLAFHSQISLHSTLVNERTVLLEAEPAFRILYFLEADSMLALDRSLLSLEPDSLVALPPDTSAVLKYGQHCRYYQLSVDDAAAPAFLRHAFMSGSLVVHLREMPGCVLQADFDRLHILYHKRRQQELRYSMAVSVLLLACAECFTKGTNAIDLMQKSHIARRVHQYLEQHFTENVSLEQLENIFFVSRHHICRQFRAHYGCTVMDYVRTKRVQLAAELLVTTNAPVSALAKSCGFGSVQSFPTAFRALHGCTPLQYRKKPPVKAAKP